MRICICITLLIGGMTLAIIDAYAYACEKYIEPCTHYPYMHTLSLYILHYVYAHSGLMCIEVSIGGMVWGVLSMGEVLHASH